MTENTIIILKEPLMDSIAADLVTLATFSAMIGLGVYLQSTAMQWTGAVVFFMGTIGMEAHRREHLTIAQARAKLDQIEAAQ